MKGAFFNQLLPKAADGGLALHPVQLSSPAQTAANPSPRPPVVAAVPPDPPAELQKRLFAHNGTAQRHPQSSVPYC